MLELLLCLWSREECCLARGALAAARGCNSNGNGRIEVHSTNVPLQVADITLASPPLAIFHALLQLFSTGKEAHTSSHKAAGQLEPVSKTIGQLRHYPGALLPGKAATHHES
eukprot:4376051-Amphidinium_carterae.2